MHQPALPALQPLKLQAAAGIGVSVCVLCAQCNAAPKGRGSAARTGGIALNMPAEPGTVSCPWPVAGVIATRYKADDSHACSHWSEHLLLTCFFTTAVVNVSVRVLLAYCSGGGCGFFGSGSGEGGGTILFHMTGYQARHPPTHACPALLVPSGGVQKWPGGGIMYAASSSESHTCVCHQLLNVSGARVGPVI